MAVTVERTKQGMGILDRQLFSPADVKTANGVRTLVSNVALPNGGMEQLRSAWKEVCIARKGVWMSPLCWTSADFGDVSFVAEVFLVKAQEGVDRLGVRVYDKAGATTEKFLETVAADVQTLSTVRFASSGTRLEKLRALEKQLVGLQQGFSVLPPFRSFKSPEEMRLAGITLVNALNDQSRGRDYYLYDDDTTGEMNVKNRFSNGGADCATVRLERNRARRSYIANSALLSTSGTLCRNAGDLDGLTWRWVS